MEAVDVHDLLQEQAQVVQAFADFLRDQMTTQAKQKKQDTAPCSVWKLGTISDLSRTIVYERI